MPVMVFLKTALKNHIWHSRCSQACFIIDDPLLKPRYGFLAIRSFSKACSGIDFAPQSPSSRGTTAGHASASKLFSMLLLIPCLFACTAVTTQEENLP